MKTTLVVGVDLAGSPKRNTGICLLRGMTVTLCDTVYSDDEILTFIKNASPDLVAIEPPSPFPRAENPLKTVQVNTFAHATGSCCSEGSVSSPLP